MASNHTQRKAVVFARNLATWLLLPAKIDLSSRLRFPLYVASFGAVVLLWVLAYPFFARTCASYFFASTPTAELKTLKPILEATAYGLDLLVAFLAGGWIFGELLLAKVRSAAETYQDSIRSALEHNNEGLNAAIELIAEHVDQLLSKATWRNMPRTMFSIMRDARRIWVLLADGLPAHYRSFAWVTLVTGFPGGAYGLLAFLTFLCGATVKLVVQWLNVYLG